MALKMKLRSLGGRYLDLASGVGDGEAEKAFKATLVLISTANMVVVSGWSVLYVILDHPFAAAIPLAYSLITAVGLGFVARTKRIGLFRTSQLTMWLTLPFLLQWSLGGFEGGSAVGMWALGAPLLASLVGAARWPWFAGFVLLSVVSGLFEPGLSPASPPLPDTVVTIFFVLNFLGVLLVVYLSIGYFVRERERARSSLEQEREKSDRLLLNVLPEAIATRLKSGEDLIADRVSDVTILFADLVGSTPLSERLTANELVAMLDELFSAFDDLADRFRLEKIKTVGDEYMVAAGIPEPRSDHVEAIADMALAMRAELANHRSPLGEPLRMRFGIETGTVVAGVIGRRKFSYDLWGDTVNTASRMETHGIADEIQVTERVYRRLHGAYGLRPRGSIEVRGKGSMDTYLLESRLPEANQRDEKASN